MLEDRVVDITAKLAEAKEAVYSPLPEFWVDDPGGDPATKRPNLGPESGPSSRAAGRKERLADYHDLHYDQLYLEKVASWSNFYAAGQVVKLVGGAAGQRSTFVPCGPSDPDARYRFQPRKDGETLQQSKSQFKQLTKDHVDLVLGILTRVGARSAKSLYEVWCTFDEGVLRDELIAASCTRDNFEYIWRVLVGAKEYGIDVKMVPWHKHLITATINLNNHAAYVIAQHQLAIDPNDPLLRPFRASVTDSRRVGSSRGITPRRKVLLALSRDVIKRSIERIKASDAWDPRPIEQQKADADSAPTGTPASTPSSSSRTPAATPAPPSRPAQEETRAWHRQDCPEETLRCLLRACCRREQAAAKGTALHLKSAQGRRSRHRVPVQSCLSRL